MDGRVDESGIPYGAWESLICARRFSYEEEWPREDMVMSSSTGWAGARGVLCEEIASSVISRSSSLPCIVVR